MLLEPQTKKGLSFYSVASTHNKRPIPQLISLGSMEDSVVHTGIEFLVPRESRHSRPKAKPAHFTQRSCACHKPVRQLPQLYDEYRICLSHLGIVSCLYLGCSHWAPKCRWGKLPFAPAECTSAHPRQATDCWMLTPSIDKALTNTKRLKILPVITILTSYYERYNQAALLTTTQRPHYKGKLALLCLQSFHHPLPSSKVADEIGLIYMEAMRNPSFCDISGAR